MNYKDLSQGFASALGTYPGNSTFGASFYDQLRNANQGIGYLKQVKNETPGIANSMGYQNLMSGAQGMKGDAIAGGVMAGLTGITSIASNAIQASQIQDTARQQNEIEDLSRVGSYGYNNFDEIARDYSYTNFGGPDINYDDIRGMSTGQKIGNIGTSALSGAATGMQIAGPWGALAGGVIGAGASLWGVLSGDKKAKTEEGFLNAQADMAASMANANLSAAHEMILKNNDRQSAVHAVAMGGPIERKQISIKEYADKVLGKPHQNSNRCGGRITRSKCNGGTLIRIRAK